MGDRVRAIRATSEHCRSSQSARARGSREPTRDREFLSSSFAHPGDGPLILTERKQPFAHPWTLDPRAQVVGGFQARRDRASYCQLSERGDSRLGNKPTFCTSPSPRYAHGSFEIPRRRCVSRSAWIGCATSSVQWQYRLAFRFQLVSRSFPVSDLVDGECSEEPRTVRVV